VARVHGGRDTLVSFAVEDGGRLGAHAQSFLRSLAERAVRQGRRSHSPSRDSNRCIMRTDDATIPVGSEVVASYFLLDVSHLVHAATQALLPTACGICHLLLEYHYRK
jgi:hypothetical protein